MMANDQAARQDAISGKFKDPEANRRMGEIDDINTRRLSALIDQYGWLTRSMVGQDGAHAAWLLVQHADMDSAFQQRCLRLMESFLAADEVSQSDFAYLTDRVLVNQGRLQRYGTQMQQVDGDFELKPTEDPENLDKRRALMGLSTMAEYREQMRTVYGSRKKP